jgi:hypothetical protein
MNMSGPLSFDFTAKRHRRGLLISGHVRGKRPGVPYLQPEVSPVADVRVYRLCFRTDARFDTGGFDHIEPNPSPEWQTIRILLPNAQEFVIHSRAK